MTENDLHQYQLQAVEHIISHTHCALFLDMGLGKTVSTLTAINELMFKEVEVRRVLVIAPKRVAESVWTQEVEKWDHLKHIKVSRIIGTERQRREALAKKADVYTIGRDNVAWLCGLYGGSCLPFDMVVIDELSSFKNPKSIRFKALKHVQASLSRVVGLTGTPAPNGLMDLWAQMYLLDRGERLGKYISHYRDNYFKPRARGEHFELHPLDPHYDENSPRPKFIVAILPLIILFILFNVVGVDINICIIISVVVSIALFWNQLKDSSIRELLSTGAAESIHMSMTVAAICGFAGVVTNTEAFTSMLNAIVSIDMSPMLICAIVVAVMCMLTGGSSTGQLISLPLIAPKLMELGLSAGAIHRIGCFAATTLDSLPYSGAILMLLPLCRMKLREVYPPLFITTVVATTCGTAAVIITCALFPGLT